MWLYVTMAATHLMCTLLAAMPASSASAADRDEIVAEAGDAWKNLLENAAQVSYVLLVHGDDGEVWPRRVCSAHWRDGYYLCETGSAGERSIEGQNGRYSFKVTERDGKFYLDRAEKLHGRASLIAARGCPGWMLYGVPLGDLLADPAHTWVSCKRTDSLVTIELRLAGDDPRFRDAHLTLELDPGNYWLLKRFRREIPAESSSGGADTYNEFVYAYQQDPNGVPMTERVSMKTGKLSTREYDAEQVLEIVDVEASNRSPEEFTLPHYGIPEPEWASRRSGAYGWILMVAGSILAVLAVYLSRSRSRT